LALTQLWCKAVTRSCTMKSTIMLIICLLAGCSQNQRHDDEAKADRHEKHDDVEKSKSQNDEAKADHQAEILVRNDNGLQMKLVWCPPGKFNMGPKVVTTLTQGFWLGRFEVTQSEWKEVMQSEPWKEKLVTKEGADFPATWVSWNDATEFCCKLTGQERQAGRLSNDWEYTLPTEAQWERACRAQTETIFSFGDDEKELGDYAWFRDNALMKSGEKYAHRVGQKKANPWGIYDVHGNVWEWCRDIYAEKLPGGSNPEVMPDENTKEVRRINRGGGWGGVADHCRSAFRMSDLPDYKSGNLGFRVALSAVESFESVK